VASWQAYRAERAAQEARESLAIQQWLEEKAPTDEEEAKWKIGPGRVIMGVDPGNPTGIAFYESELDACYAQAYDRNWMPERPISNRPSNHDMGMAIDLPASSRMPSKLREMMAIKTDEILRSAPRQPSFRRGNSREAIIQNIVHNTQPVEVEWDVATMLDAHRNGATALDGQRTDLLEAVETPVFEELATVMFDPNCEMGPRERDWHRRQHNRNQPVNRSRRQRSGKKGKR
jgi:hypothetical protein